MVCPLKRRSRHVHGIHRRFEVNGSLAPDRLVVKLHMFSTVSCGRKVMPSTLRQWLLSEDLNFATFLPTHRTAPAQTATNEKPSSSLTDRRQQQQQQVCCHERYNSTPTPLPLSSLYVNHSGKNDGMLPESAGPQESLSLLKDYPSGKWYKPLKARIS